MKKGSTPVAKERWPMGVNECITVTVWDEKSVKEQECRRAGRQKDRKVGMQ